MSKKMILKKRIKIDPKLHKKIKMAAAKKGISMSKFIENMFTNQK